MQTTPEILKTLATGLTRSAEQAAAFTTEGYVVVYGDFLMPMHVTRDAANVVSYGLLGDEIAHFPTKNVADRTANALTRSGRWSTRISVMPAAEWRIAYLVATVKLAAEAMKGAQ